MQTPTITKSMFSRKAKRKSDRSHRYCDNSHMNIGNSSSTPTASNSQLKDSDELHGKKSKMFTIGSDRSPLWTTLTHAQTITEFVES